MSIVKGFNIDGFILDMLSKGVTEAVVSCSVVPTNFKHKRKKVCNVTLRSSGVIESFNIGGTDKEIADLSSKLGMLKTMGYIENLKIGTANTWMKLDRLVL